MPASHFSRRVQIAPEFSFPMALIVIILLKVETMVGVELGVLLQSSLGD
jgi:hypothetical protein